MVLLTITYIRNKTIEIQRMFLIEPPTNHPYLVLSELLDEAPRYVELWILNICT